MLASKIEIAQKGRYQHKPEPAQPRRLIWHQIPLGNEQEMMAVINQERDAVVRRNMMDACAILMHHLRAGNLV